VNLYVVSVLEPGTRKSAVLAEITGPLVERERELVEAARPEVERARLRKEVAQQQAAALKGEVRKGKASAEEAIEAGVEAALLELPVLPRLLADDATPEALGSLLAEQGGRMALLSDEGGPFELMAGRYQATSGPNLGVYLKGHSTVTPLRVDRKGRDPEHVDRPTLTIGLIRKSTVSGQAPAPGAA
jgi:Protein of unknown function (DUF3987)